MAANVKRYLICRIKSVLKGEEEEEQQVDFNVCEYLSKEIPLRKKGQTFSQPTNGKSIKFSIITTLRIINSHRSRSLFLIYP